MEPICENCIKKYICTRTFKFQKGLIGCSDCTKQSNNFGIITKMIHLLRELQVEKCEIKNQKSIRDMISELIKITEEAN